MKGDLTDFHTLLCILTFVYNFKKDYAASRNFALRAVATVATNITSGNTGRQGTFMAPIDPWMATTQAEPINPATNNRQDELIGTHWVWPCSFQSSHNQAPRSHPEAISPPKSHEALREGVNGKKTFSFGHCPNDGGGVYPCPNFLALFQEVHFWSIKRVFFFKNVLNF